MLLRVFEYALFLLGTFLNVRVWRTICRLVDECRADDPSRRFSEFWWIGAGDIIGGGFRRAGCGERL
jgi:hypothetical protein